jgi:CBS domain containing-hemolysin-like protein
MYYEVFFIATATVLVVSCICSLLEAVLYAIPASQIETLAGQGRKTGAILKRLYEDIDRPIAAILSLNTLANTGGAAIAGAAFVKAFPKYEEVYFTVGISLGVLIFSEIIPKTTGVIYARSLASSVARPIQFLIWIFAPFILLNKFVTRLITRKGTALADITLEEVKFTASMARRAGAVTPEQEKVIHNILEMDDRRARDIMTPRTVVFSLNQDLDLTQARQEGGLWPHSRVPLYMNDKDNVVGLVLRRDVFTALTDGRQDLKLVDLGRQLYTVPEAARVSHLLEQFLKRREHLFRIIDEYGSFVGIVTLEDVLEEIVGEEIVGEFDPAVNMQERAKQRFVRTLGIPPKKGED